MRVNGTQIKQKSIYLVTEENNIYNKDVTHLGLGHFGEGITMRTIIMLETSLAGCFPPFPALPLPLFHHSLPNYYPIHPMDDPSHYHHCIYLLEP